VVKAFDQLALTPDKITKEVMEQCLNSLSGVSFIPKFEKGKNPMMALHEAVGKFPTLPREL